jgi:aerobic carbon-monoxide dehydrogenase medium subunit
MFPSAFNYEAPTTIADAVGLLTGHEDARVLAGGQSLIPLMKLRFAQPSLIVDVGRIPELRNLEMTEGMLRIGATVREAEIENAPDVCRAFPILHDTVCVIADPLVRNMATIGGNLAHGDAENDHPATMIALDATIAVRGTGSERVIPAGEFFRGLYETALDPAEILTEIRIPALPQGCGTCYIKVHRQAGDFAIAAVAVRVTIDGDVVRDSRIVYTAVAATPQRAVAAENVLRGQRLDTEVLTMVAETAAGALDIHDDPRGTAGYKRRVLRTITGRALRLAGRRAAERELRC